VSVILECKRSITRSFHKELQTPFDLVMGSLQSFLCQSLKHPITSSNGTGFEKFPRRTVGEMELFTTNIACLCHSLQRAGLNCFEVLSLRMSA
jgi:hypothetical protein